MKWLIIGVVLILLVLLSLAILGFFMIGTAWNYLYGCDCNDRSV